VTKDAKKGINKAIDQVKDYANKDLQKDIDELKKDVDKVIKEISE
jgi:predicted nucleotide-binding protein (sugar kinase/HSP70/actin superfamily)